jgi:hypothetical protein
VFAYSAVVPERRRRRAAAAAAADGPSGPELRVAAFDVSKLQGSPSAQQYLQALQQLLVQYDFTLPATTLFRPVLLKAVAGLVGTALNNGKGGCSSATGVRPGPELAVALLSVLELAPHTEGCVAALVAGHVAACS